MCGGHVCTQQTGDTCNCKLVSCPHVECFQQQVHVLPGMTGCLAWSNACTDRVVREETPLLTYSVKGSEDTFSVAGGKAK